MYMHPHSGTLERKRRAKRMEREEEGKETKTNWNRRKGGVAMKGECGEEQEVKERRIKSREMMREMTNRNIVKVGRRLRE